MTQTLTRGQARRFYDRLGAFQDRQAFYEDKALDVLIEHGKFSEANRVLEIGCGTGRLAARLLSDHLPSSAQYLALDQSPRMVSLAQQRLEPFRERAEVRLTDGGFNLPTAADGEPFDRVITTYVLDLLSDDDIRACLAAVRGALSAAGLLCNAGLGYGSGGLAVVLTTLWQSAFRLNSHLTGGCRPLELENFLEDWQVVYRRLVVSAAITSEVVIATPGIDQGFNAR